ncbi:hypothetical protein [Actinomadura livida]|nr:MULTISPECIES: hypothetical protein [Actinomadura]MBB4776948.1 hypothetical protein [Actinomadura catellatispora]
MSELPPRTVVLRDHSDENGTRHLRAVRNTSGDITLEGHDLGKGVSDVFGPGITEYEWAHQIAASDAARLLTALGGGPGDDVLDLLPTGPSANIYGLLRTHGIPYTATFSRHGS